MGTSIGDPALEDAYRSFTLQDRKGNIWVYRGPHRDSEQPSMAMQFYYRTLPGFFFPTLELEAQPPVGTITPYLRPVETILRRGSGVQGMPWIPAGAMGTPSRWFTTPCGRPRPPFRWRNLDIAQTGTSRRARPD